MISQFSNESISQNLEGNEKTNGVIKENSSENREWQWILLTNLPNIPKLWIYIAIVTLFIIMILLLFVIYAIARRQERFNGKNKGAIEFQLTENQLENDYEEVVIPNNDYDTPQRNTIIIKKPDIKSKPKLVPSPRYLPMAPIKNKFEIIPIKLKPAY